MSADRSASVRFRFVLVQVVGREFLVRAQFERQPDPEIDDLRHRTSLRDDVVTS
jgi:hypothetical protein